MARSRPTDLVVFSKFERLLQLVVWACHVTVCNRRFLFRKSVLLIFTLKLEISPPFLTMLSAVAARKAALAAQVEQAKDFPIPSGSGTTTPALPRLLRNETPKRKSTTQKSRSTNKKSKKSEHKIILQEEKTVDTFRDQTDIITVESDGDDGSDSAMSGLDAFGQDSLDKNVAGMSTKRAWSPSQPVEDSSDDESVDGDDESANPLDVSSLFPYLSRSLRTPGQTPNDNNVLSTFEPALDQNMFILTEDECHLLGLSGKATLIALDVDDSICVLGICVLVVLHGSISLCGATISSSSAKHRVYAPRSAPLPVIRAGEETGSTSQVDNLPPRLRDALQYRAIVILQELKPDVIGLGRICRTFEGVFEPSRWQKSSVEAPFNIPGLYMVRSLVCYFESDFHNMIDTPTKQRMPCILDASLVVHRSK